MRTILVAIIAASLVAAALAFQSAPSHAASPSQCVDRPGSTQPSPMCGGAQVCQFDRYLGLGQGWITLCGYNNWDYALVSTSGVVNPGGNCLNQSGVWANALLQFYNAGGAFNFCGHDYSNYHLNGFKAYNNLRALYGGNGVQVHVWGFATT